MSVAIPALQPSLPVRALRTAGEAIFMVAAVAVLAAATIYAGMQFAGFRFYEVNSPSMAPGIEKGDVVAVRTVAPHTIEAGDVIVFTRPGFSDPIVHRVTRVKSDPDVRSILLDRDGKELRAETAYAPRTFWTKGDANEVEDVEPVPESLLVGEQKLVVPAPFNLIVTRFDRQLLFAAGIAAIAAYIAWESLDGIRLVIRRRRGEVRP